MPLDQRGFALPEVTAPQRDPMTLEALRDWLERQPARKRYCYGDRGRCLAAQYCGQIGVKYKVARLWDHDEELDSTFEQHLERIAVQHPQTFGAAYERCLTLIAKRTA